MVLSWRLASQTAFLDLQAVQVNNNVKMARIRPVDRIRFVLITAWIAERTNGANLTNI